MTSAGQVSPGGAELLATCESKAPTSNPLPAFLMWRSVVLQPGRCTTGSRLPAATLGGTLNVSVINGYQAPTTGIIYGVLPYASRTGSFASITGLV